MKPKRTILCVADNDQALSIRKLMLETRGYRVIACANAHDALERFRNGGIDLVFAEVATAALDGARLIDNIKDIAPHIPAVLLSARSRGLERENRADLFLTKTMCNSIDLLERIRILLVRKRGPKRVYPAAQAQSHSAGAA